MSYVDPRSFRTNFPIVEKKVYLSSCSLGARSQQLDTAMSTMLDAMGGGADAWHMFEAQVTASREKFARLIGASPSQIAVMPNASVGAYQVASCIDWQERSEILTSEAEFPSIAHVWLAQKERGAKVSYTAATDEAAYIDRLNAKTGLVSVPIVAYSDGQRLDVRAIADAAHAQGSRVFVDAYQAVGVEPVDVTELDCDFLVAGSSKYMLGLPGVAFVYVREPLRDDCEPQLTGWFGRENPFAFDNRKLDFAGDARRYETGTPSVPALYAANAGLDLLLNLDMSAVRQHIVGLVDHVQDRMRDIEVETRGPEMAAERGAHVALYDPVGSDLQAHLANAEISVSPRGDLARLAFHYYNTKDDADAVCDTIAEFRARPSKKRDCANCKTPCASGLTFATPDLRARAAVVRWRAKPLAANFPYQAVIAAIHENGKAFISEPLLGELDAIRADLGLIGLAHADCDLLVRFLDVALDKFDGTYEYPSYCALPLWPLPTNPGATPDPDNIDAGRDRQLLALATDYLRFELDAAQGRTALMPQMRPEVRKSEKRVRLGLNSARYAIERLGLPVDPDAKDAGAEAAKLCDIVRDMLSDDERLALTLTMQPVYVVHDEYMFLRILQSFETNFAWMAIRLRSAIAAFDTDPSRVAGLILDANRMYMEAAKLFPVLATLQADAFQVFREHTEGASAIQSRNYKTVESLCRAPDEDRRDSLAYKSTPEVRDNIIAGQPSIDAALTKARALGRLDADTDAEIAVAMEAFALTLQKWRQTHYRLAVKMLGEMRGTGNTEGPGYLSAVRSIPVFQTVAQGDLPC